jgi:hypothetical protein
MNELFFILVGIVIVFIGYQSYKILKSKLSRKNSSIQGGTDSNLDQKPDTKVK